MGRKKVTNGTSDAEGLRLEGALLWKWRALDAELRASIAEMESVAQQIAAEVAKYHVLSTMFQKRAALTGSISVAKTELTSVQAEIEQTMGISLKDCAFDDKTGRLYNLAEDGSRGEPLKQPRKKTSKRL